MQRQLPQFKGKNQQAPAVSLLPQPVASTQEERRAALSVHLL